MASNGIDFDTSELEAGLSRLEKTMDSAQRRAVKDVATEILRLSQFEVPHDIGTLQTSGHVEDEGDDSIVGYNTVYASRLHEHPEYRFQKGRKGKYLENPIKMNLAVFRSHFESAIGKSL